MKKHPLRLAVRCGGWLALAGAPIGSLVAQVVPPAAAAAPAPVAAHLSLVYFPPDPPVLGAALGGAAPATDPRRTAPAELADFVNEPFYAPLSIRLAENNLDATQRAQLASYHAAKVALAVELRAQLEALKDADPSARLRTLETFARQQTPRIVKLEENAEQLRSDLVADGLSSAASGNGRRSWVPGVDRLSKPRAETPASERQVMRDAAFFQDGLSADQRRLLREAAMELAGAIAQPRSAPTVAGPVMYFSPDTARVRLPANLPDGLAAKVAAYTAEKAALKQEIRDVLLVRDGASAGDALARALARLAERQAPRLAALEQLAEEVRRGLVQLPNQPPPLGRLNLPPMPPQFEARVAAYRREKAELQKALLARIDDVARGGGGAHAVDKAPASTAGADERIRQVIAAFTQENAARYAALDKSKEAIRSELARLASTGAIVVTGPFADVLSRKFSEALQQLETWRNYRDYQVAVFEPGLSPPQRRLLFDFAVADLALPLPAGESPPD